MNSKTTTHIDASGLICPMPLMLLKQTMQDIPAGAKVCIEVTDVHAELDFEIWCERFGHTLDKIQDNDPVMRFLVTKGQLND